MRRRILGRTGIVVSEIGFGCGPTAGLMVDGSFEQRKAVVGRALELGITYFDTAPGYGNSRSEVHLGETLRACGARDVVVATKVALSAQDLAAPAEAVLRSVESSLGNLGMQRIQLLQLHNRIATSRDSPSNLGSSPILALDDVLGPGGVLSAFDHLRRRGVVQHFGCSAYGGEMEAVDSLIDSGGFDVISVNFSMLNLSAWDGAPAPLLRDYAGIGRRAAAAGLGVIALRVLEGGLLAGATPSGGSATSEQKALLLHARTMQHRLVEADAPLPATAIRHALSNEQLSCVLLGLSDEQQVEAAAAAAAFGPLPETELVAILHPLSHEPDPL